MIAIERLGYKGLIHFSKGSLVLDNADCVKSLKVLLQMEENLILQVANPVVDYLEENLE